MSYLPPLPPELQQVEYVKLYFHLQLKGYFDLQPLGLLQFRRELLRSLHTLESWGSDKETTQLKAVLQPTLSPDPLVRKRAQKPAPAFVLSPDPQLHGMLEPKQIIVLPVLFVGQGIQAVDAFITLIQQLGQQGLVHGEGQFMLEAVETEDASGVRMMLWSGEKESFVPPVSDLYWWLERQTLTAEKVFLDVLSPLRLIQQKKPLFKINFIELFPFVMRRVSSMLTSYAGVELFNDPQLWVEQARRVNVLENKLRWQDWRRLQGDSRTQDLGGLMGCMELDGETLSGLLWVLQLGSLFNVGKGATYGSGQYRLKTHC